MTLIQHYYPLSFTADAKSNRGQVVTEADEKETILYGDVDLDYLDEVRAHVPVRNQKRTELYTLPATK